MYIGRRHLFSLRRLSKFGTEPVLESTVVSRTKLLNQYERLVTSRLLGDAKARLIPFYFKNNDSLRTQCCRCSPTGRGDRNNG